MARATPHWLHEIDHTADVGINVTAPDRNTLYERAALGTFGVLTDLTTVEERMSKKVTVEASDPERLMVRWLSELNFLHTTKHLLFSRFDVEVSGPDDALTLRAACHGEPIDRDRHPVYTEIKAVTYHDMKIQHHDNIWEVQVIFDL
ncbi:archease [Longibacter salinarum]|nr:archease [Longibacter salinarum]